MMIDLILYNGNIVTLDDQKGRVTALAISQGRVVTAGRDDEVLGLARPDTVLNDLNGKLVIPGLTDAHIHWQWLARSLNEVNLVGSATREEALERVAEWVREAEKGQWITGRGWAQGEWPDRAFPTASDLDRIVPDTPVALRARSGHASWVNSAALRLGNVTSETPDPPGGEIVRDAEGNPTGVLLETAERLVTAQIPSLSSEQIAEQMKGAQKLALAAGLTGIHDFDGPSCLRALQVLRERGDLALRVVKNINKEWIEHAQALGLRWGFGDDWLRIGGLKIFADGALGPRTAFMIEPYAGEVDNYGIAVTDKEEMAELVSRASANGLPSTIHAIGDRANHDVLDVYDAVRNEEAEWGVPPKARRHRIEHVQILHPDDVPRLARMGIVASFQPIHATSDYPVAEQYWGERNQWAYNIRAQIDQGAAIALGSDSPVEPFAPLTGIHAAVTRQRADGSPGPEGWYPDLRITVDEALRGYTLGPAYAAGMEDRLGKLAPGYLADLVVLDRDLYAIPPGEILDVQVLATMVDGEWRFGEV